MTDNKPQVPKIQSKKDNSNWPTDQQFEVLDCPSQMVQAEQSISQGKTSENKSQKPSELKTNQKADLVQDQLLNQQKAEQEDKLCSKCQKCIDLEEKLNNTQSQRYRLQTQLKDTALELAMLKRNQKQIQETTINKGELNYCVASLKEIIQCYQQQNLKLTNFIYKTMNMTPKSRGEKPTAQIVQNFVTDFMVNWYELNKQLNSLLVSSSPNGEVSLPKQQQPTYNYYATSAKIEKLRQNINQLQKLARRD